AQQNRHAQQYKTDGSKITHGAVAFLFHLVSSKVVFQVIDLTGIDEGKREKQCYEHRGFATKR
ncbi:hypothetical protein, partial [Citrobacter koseri]|uniref:hypothetical protein n=1 Tax=Citrobacter koseri TaxID=545 RepID=UPI001A9262B3